MRHQRFMGLLFVMASSALYGISPLVVTSLVECGVHYSSVMFFKGGIAAIELLALACASRQRLRLSRDESVSLVLAGLLHAATSFFLYGSYERLATGLATALHFTYPLFVALFCFLLFRDRINLRGMVGVCMATAGTAFFIWNSAASQTSMTGLLMAVASAIVYALYLIVMKKFPAANVSSAVFALYEMACSAMFSCISSALMGHLHVQLTARGWLLAVLGATMLAACVILIKAGMNRISAQEASILCVLEPIVSLVAGALILHEIISVKAAVGSALVIGAALAICFPARATAKNL